LNWLFLPDLPQICKFFQRNIEDSPTANYPQTPNFNEQRPTNYELKMLRIFCFFSHFFAIFCKISHFFSIFFIFSHFFSLFSLPILPKLHGLPHQPSFSAPKTSFRYEKNLKILKFFEKIFIFLHFYSDFYGNLLTVIDLRDKFRVFQP